MQRRMPRLIIRNLRLMLQGKPNIIQPIQQTMPHKFIDRKLSAKPLLVPHLALLQINGELVIINLKGAPHQLGNFIFAQAHREEAVLRAVIGKDVGKRRRNHRPESEIGQRPNRMLPRRAAAKILPRNQNAGARITRLIQNKPGVLLPIRREPPVIKQKLPKAGPLNPLQKLFRDDLVSINIDPLQRRHTPKMLPK